MNQYKYLGLNLQNTGRLTAQIDSLKIKVKKMTKIIFHCNLTKNTIPPFYSRNFSNNTSYYISGTLPKPWA
jgi:hypothetical protein